MAKSYLLERKVGNDTVNYVWVSLNERGAVVSIGTGRNAEEAEKQAKPVVPGEFVGGRLASLLGYGQTPYYTETAQKFQDMVDEWSKEK